MTKEQQRLIAIAFDCLDTLTDTIAIDHDEKDGDKMWEAYSLLTLLYTEHCKDIDD